MRYSQFTTIQHLECKGKILIHGQLQVTGTKINIILSCLGMDYTTYTIGGSDPIWDSYYLWFIFNQFNTCKLECCYQHLSSSENPTQQQIYYTHTPKHVHTHAHKHTYTCIHIHACLHIHMHSWTHIYTVTRAAELTQSCGGTIN